MTDQTPPDSFDEEPKPRALDGDREFPTIAQGSNASKFGIFAFLAVGVIAIIFVAMDGMEQSAPRELTTPEEIEFRTPTPSGPYIEIEEQAEVPLEQLVPPIDERELYDPLEAQRALQMQQEALRLAREQKKRMEERRRSPQVIFDNSGSAQGNIAGGATSQGGTGSLIGGGEQDPNIAFANQYANSDVEVATASQLQNLDTLVTQGTLIDGILETAIPPTVHVHQTVEVTSRSKKKSMRYETPIDNISQRGRPLIEKHEMRDFPESKEIILMESSSPIKADKLKYFSDKNFKSREIAAPIVSKLDIMENDIPKFDIPTEEEKKAQKTKDPNQSDMFDKKNESIADTIPDEENHSEDVLELLSGNLN